MKINIPSCNPESVRRISERYSIPLLLATILQRRGVEEKDIIYYLEDEFMYQESPFMVEDMYTAIERIEEAIEGGENILIFGDRDVDGITSTAIMYKCLKKLGAKSLGYRLPEGDESYGLTEKIVDEILEKKVTLLITVDNGISALDEIRTLEREGVSVIVTDHHIPGEKLPPATAILNPKVEGSGFRYTSLAGCAVAARLCWALFFSRTPLYDNSVILLHAEPGNETIRISAVKLENLIEVDRISDEVLIGDRNATSSRLFEFLSCSLPILVLDSDTEKAMLKKAFGGGVDIELVDIRPQLEMMLSYARGRSLYELAQVSKSARYVHSDKELATLVSLFKSISIYRYPELSKDFEDIMQLEAIGTISDLMPMTGDNRLIVKKGLKLLSKTPIMQLQYLLAKQNLINKPLTAQDISYRISPVLNAAGRMGIPSKALSLLLAEDQGECEVIADELIALNTQRQKSEENALSEVKDIAKSSFDELNGQFVLIEDDNIPRGLTGTISSKLLNEYGVPVLVMASMDDRVSASMRCKEPFNAREFLSDFSFLFDDYGGHKFAAGFSMAINNKDVFISLLKKKILELEAAEAGESIIDVDAEIPTQYMNLDIWNINKYIEPYGQENTLLKLYAKDAIIEEIYALGSNPKHVKLMLRYGEYSWPALWWNCDNKAELFKGRHVSLVFSPDFNYWKGEAKPQLLIYALEPIEALS